MILEVFLSFILLYYIPRVFIFFKKLYRTYSFVSKLPGPKAKFLVGNALDVGHESFETAKAFLKWADDERAKGNNIMRLWIGFRAIVFPLNGEALKPILDSTEELTKGDDYDYFAPWLGYGLLISTGSKWKSRRRMLTPTFHFAMLDGYVEKMDKHARILLDILDGHLGNEIEIYQFIKRCALDIICDTAMGKELNSQHNPDHPYVLAVGEFNLLQRDRSMKPHYWFPPYWYLFHERRNNQLLNILTTFTKEVIAERVHAHETGELHFEEVGHRKAFLDMLIEMKEKNHLSFEDIREEVDTFMFEGHDTTSSGMAWTLWCIATNPEVQEKAYQEILEVFGDSDRSITVEDLKGMPYLERVLKETFRIFPAVPQVQRKPLNDFAIGEHIIPAGTDIFIAPLVVHHNKDVYKDDWVFDPDRFLVENISERHAYDFVPFSAGLRNCIGQRFAMYEEKLVIAWILRRFSLHTHRHMLDNEPGPETVLRPSLGVPVTLKRR